MGLLSLCERTWVQLVFDIRTFLVHWNKQTIRCLLKLYPCRLSRAENPSIVPELRTFLLASCPTNMRMSDPLPIRILSHNIRYATNAPIKGEEKWEIRKSYLINELCFSTAHCAESLICLQEVLHGQLVDILAGVNNEAKTWDFVGVGRDDGMQAGEYSPILYTPCIWELISHKTKWLSKTPDRPSKSWDAASTRILTIAVLQHRSTRKTLVAMNTHLDDQGSKSRLEAAKIIKEQIRVFADRGPQRRGLPVFLAGDFNSEPEQEAYKEMTGRDSPMSDLQLMVPKRQHYGDLNTYTGFDAPTTRPKRIDFIFVNETDPSPAYEREAQANAAVRWWQADGYAVLPNRFEDRLCNSDHRAVVGDLYII